jgi:hypothetical protein
MWVLRLALYFCAIAPFASAQPPSLYYSGALELEYPNHDSRDARIGYFDANLGYRFDNYQAANVGFDVFGYAIKDEIYSAKKVILSPSMTIDTSWGTTFIGHPRNARRSLFDINGSKPSIHMEIDYIFGIMPRSFVEVSPLSNRQTTGIRHDINNDRYDASISIHDVKTYDGNSIQVGYLAAKYRLNDNITLVSSGEFSKGAQINQYGGEFNNNFEFGTIASLGALEGSLIYASGFHSADIENWHASATYAFSDNLSGMFNYSVLDIADYNVASVGLSYAMEEQVSITASASELASISSRLRTYSLGVSLNF